MLTDQQLAAIAMRAQSVPRRVRQNAAAYASLLLERRDAVSGERATMCADQAEHAFATMERDVDSLAADVPALLAEVQALRAQRAALAGVLAAVETPAHNAAVLRSGVNMLDYTHGMESLAPAPAVEAR